MNITLDEAIATISDYESIEAVLQEIFANIEDLQTERDQLKIKVLAYKVAKKKYKSKIKHSFTTDNFNITWRDDTGRKQSIRKSFKDGGDVKIMIRGVK